MRGVFFVEHRPQAVLQRRRQQDGAEVVAMARARLDLPARPSSNTMSRPRFTCTAPLFDGLDRHNPEPRGHAVHDQGALVTLFASEHGACRRDVQAGWPRSPSS